MHQRIDLWVDFGPEFDHYGLVSRVKELDGAGRLRIASDV
jgi:hypothetical protein